MDIGAALLAQTGDDFMPWIIAGIVVIALIVLIIAFVLMRRSKR